MKHNNLACHGLELGIVKNVESWCMKCNMKFESEEEDSETEIEKDDNENDTDERKGETSTNDGAGRKRCLIYKKDMETHRIEIPFKDSIVEKNEEDNETTDDPKNGGKKEVNQNQKDAFPYLSY